MRNICVKSKVSIGVLDKQISYILMTIFLEERYKY